MSKNRSQLITEIDANLATNNSGDITAAVLRGVEHDIISNITLPEDLTPVIDLTAHQLKDSSNNIMIDFSGTANYSAPLSFDAATNSMRVKNILGEKSAYLGGNVLKLSGQIYDSTNGYGTTGTDDNPKFSGYLFTLNNVYNKPLGSSILDNNSVGYELAFYVGGNSKWHIRNRTNGNVYDNISQGLNSFGHPEGTYTYAYTTDTGLPTNDDAASFVLTIDPTDRVRVLCNTYNQGTSSKGNPGSWYMPFVQYGISNGFDSVTGLNYLYFKNIGMQFASAPGTSSDSGIPGQMAVNFTKTQLYICVGTTAWRRITLSPTVP